MIEAPGAVICCFNPWAPPVPLPFAVTSLSRSLLVALHMADLTGPVFNVCPAEQARAEAVPQPGAPAVAPVATRTVTRSTPLRLTLPASTHLSPRLPRPICSTPSPRATTRFSHTSRALPARPTPSSPLRRPQVRDIVRCLQTEHLSITDALTKTPSRLTQTSSTSSVDGEAAAPPKRKVETLDDVKNLQKGNAGGTALNLSDQRIKQVTVLETWRPRREAVQFGSGVPPKSCSHGRRTTILVVQLRAAALV